MVENVKLKLDTESLITADLIKRYNGENQQSADPIEFKIKSAELALVLELAHQDFLKSKAAAQIVEQLAGRLHSLRQGCDASTWKQIIPIAQNHRVAEFFLQDPFTSWSFEKPRGYSGDATLLDIYYKHPSADGIIASSTPLGREIYAYTSEAASSAAGRERRDILASIVDRVAENVDGAEILAVACGHLREAEISDALRENKLKRWIALDQDPESIALVGQNNPANSVEPMQGSVRGILRRSYDLGKFDLVYASGLYDYLPHAVGVRLLQRLMELVKPGGELLFANFSDEITTDGYMETFMDWPLILRSSDHMWEIINAAVDRNAVSAEVYYGSNRNIVYGKIRLKG